MRKAMADAEVGDDVFGDDPTVLRLQEKAAELLGTLLPEDRVPDHATMGRWAQAAGRRAGNARGDHFTAPVICHFVPLVLW